MHPWNILKPHMPKQQLQSLLVVFLGLSWRKINVEVFSIKLELTNQWSMGVIHVISQWTGWLWAEVNWGELRWRHLWGGSQRGRPAASSLAPNVLTCGIVLTFLWDLVCFQLRFGDVEAKRAKAGLSSWLQRRWETWLSSRNKSQDLSKKLRSLFRRW